MCDFNNVFNCCFLCNIESKFICILCPHTLCCVFFVLFFCHCFHPSFFGLTMEWKAWSSGWQSMIMRKGNRSTNKSPSIAVYSKNCFHQLLSHHIMSLRITPSAVFSQWWYSLYKLKIYAPDQVDKYVLILSTCVYNNLFVIEHNIYS